MSANPSPSLEGQALSRLEVLCERFETAWSSGTPPRIDDYLQQVPAEQHEAVLAELLPIELSWRRKLGESASESDYRERFPRHTSVISAAFHAAAMQDSRQGEAGESTILAAETPDTQRDTVAIRPGMRLGDHELLEEIARGGMGVVYKARHAALGRLEALKLIKSGELADEHEVRRFQMEAAAAAQLDHPGIVPVYEVGQHAGQHYMALAYVDGESLWQRVRQSPLEPREAARLMHQVAEAVQYAHDHGIIHRDLKPQNILLTRDGQPRVTDFGLAKRHQGDSSLTATGQLLGTPSYMPPEQAAGKMEAVGPAADVYALGATLYCLLTGRPPFQAAHVVETLQQVLQRDPVAPRTINPEIDRDLETICLKCLEKAPPARYLTASDLAADLKRFDRGEPILARPIGRPARAWRWCRRQPLAAGFVATAASLVAVLAIGGPVWAFRESRLRAEADASNQDAVRAVNESFTRISEDRLLNEPGFQPLRRELLQSSLGYYQDFVRRRAGDQRMQAELARAYHRLGLITEEIGGRGEAAEYYEQSIAGFVRLAAQRELSFDERRSLANCRADLAEAFRLLGNNRHSAEAYQQALSELRALSREKQDVAYDLGRVLHEYGLLQYMSLGDYLAAGALLEEAIPIVEPLWRVRAAPDDANLLAALYYSLANVRRFQGQLHAARDLHLQAIEVREPVAKAYPHIASYQFQLARIKSNIAVLINQDLKERNVDLAAQYLDDAVAALERLVERNPDVAEYRMELAGALVKLGNLELFERDPVRAQPHLERSRELLEQVLAVRPDEPRVLGESAILLTNLSVVEPDPDASLRLARQSAELLQSLHARHPETVDFRVGLAMAELQLGNGIMALGQPAEARPWIESAVGRLRNETPAYIEALGGPDMRREPWRRLAQLYESLGLAGEMAAVLEECRSQAQGDPIGLFMVALSYAHCAALVGRGRTDMSEVERAQRRAYAQSAVDVLSEAANVGLWRPSLLLETSGDWSAILEDAELRSRLAELDARSAQNPDGELRFMQQMAEMARQYMRQHPREVAFRQGLLAAQLKIGDLYANRGDLAAARSAYESAVQTALALQHDPELQSLLGYLYHDTGKTIYLLGDAHAAVPHLQRALAIKEKLAEADPSLPRDELALCVNYLGSVVRRTGDVDGARAHFQRAYDLYQGESAGRPGDANALANVASACANLGRLELQSLRPAEAARWFQEAIDQLEPLEQSGQLKAPHTNWLQEFRVYLKLSGLADQAAADTAVALAQPPDEAAYLLIHRAAVLARDGRWQEVSDTAELLAPLVSRAAENHYLQARLYARCAEALSLIGDARTPEQQSHQKAYEDQSLAALRQALEAGFEDVAEIRRQTDLIVIRVRPEYTELLRNR